MQKTNYTLEEKVKPLPKDLQIDSQPDSVDKDKFRVSVTGLELDKSYAFQFQYVFADGSTSQWSPGYVLLTPTETVPGAPTATVTGGAGFIKIDLPTFPTNATRVDVRIAGGIFGDGTKVADSFSAAGTKTIVAPGGASPGFEYVVSLLTVTPTKINGDPSPPVTVFVTTTEESIEAPTLPSGLTVGTEPFGVSVGWAGTYATEGFDGFKSIDIHVRASDVGTTATTGFSATTLVANLTVDEVANKQNIGLDNLRQALGLTTNQDVYTATPFFYFIARNDNDELYSVSGTPTYTRINSTAIVPTKANLVDLENGIISIENLVAGNGRFTSWLRAGGSYNDGVFGGGTRIELSAVNDFPDPTNALYTIAKGLTAYNSGNTKIFDLDLDAGTLAIEGGGKFTGSLEIGSSNSNSIFKAQPTTGIWLGHADYVDAPFRVSTTGILRAQSGTIGGWNITGSVLESSDTLTTKISLNPATPKIALLNAGVEKITIDPVEGIVGPTINIGTVEAPNNVVSFKITPGGNAQLAGTIYADSGHIGGVGGWTITSKTISGGPSGPSTVGLQVASTVGDISIWAGTDSPQKRTGLTTQNLGSPFYVLNTGFLKSTYGEIGGWTIDSNDIYAGTGENRAAMSVRTTEEFYAFWAGSSAASTSTPFSVTNKGNLRATNAYIRGEVLASSGGFGVMNSEGTAVQTGWTINATAGNIESTGFSAGTTKVVLEGSTGSIMGGNFYIGSTKTGDKILSDGTIRLGNNAMAYNPSTNVFEINPQGKSFANFKIRLNVTSNEDNNFSDTTVVQDEDGYLTTGRALQYGGAFYPTDNGPTASATVNTTGINWNYSGGAEDWKEYIRNKDFVTGDLWFSTKA